MERRRPLSMVAGAAAAAACILVLITLSVSVRPATAAVTSGAKDRSDVAVTVYNENLGLVREVRMIRLPAGRSEVRFMGVASAIKAETVRVKAIGGEGFRVIEQNYEYDLIGPERLLEKYIGKEVKIVETNEATGKERTIMATLLSTSGPIYRIGDEISIGYKGRVVLPKLPENLISKPTLVWLLQTPTAGEKEVETSYLTGGMGWKADYIAVLSPDDKKVDLSGWVTLENRSGATFRNALLKLIAGDIHRAPSPAEFRRIDRLGGIAMEAKAPAFEEEAFFEYHLYRLSERVTIKDRQTKQVRLLEANDIGVKKQLVFRAPEHYFRSAFKSPFEKEKVGVYIEVRNSKENNLGIPLPKGILRVYKADDEGALQFVGEDRIDHTPKDERIKVKLGEAFDVVAERKQTEWKRTYSVLGFYTYKVGYEISIRNHKEEDVEVAVEESVPGDWKVDEATHEWTKKDAHTLRFDVKVPKGEQVQVKYKVSVRF